MSHTTLRTRRFSRLSAGLVVAAAATATTLLGAAPAYAASVITAEVSGGTLIIDGTPFADSVVVSGGNGTINVSAVQASVTAGKGCVQQGAAVRCSGVNKITYFALQGDDTFRNDTSTPSRLLGGLGDDRLTGGKGNDQIIGNAGTDFAFGQGGFDTCTAENESGCEA